MKIVPSYIWEQTEPRNKAEHSIFELLSALNLPEKSAALHSLNLRGDKKQSWYEIDFLVITESCIYGIEVKTGFLSSRDGEWRVHKSNMDIAYKKKKSPYIQAKDATLCWRDQWLFKKFPEFRGRIDCVYMVALLQNDEVSLREMNSPELPREVVLGCDEFTVEGLKKRLKNVRDYHLEPTKRGPKRSGISREEVEFIVSKLRPNLEQSYPTGVRNFLLKNQHELTNEQYKLMDALESFDRLVIDGGAGTGKTFVLTHLVRKDVLQSKTVLILTRPEKLRSKLKLLLDNVDVCIAGPEELSKIEDNQFDTLYIDEGQDLCDEKTIFELDKKLKGGLEKSRWRWFGDFQNQLGSKLQVSEEIFDFLKGLTGNSSLYLLKRNVRNTPNVVRWLEAICQARMGETVMAGVGPEVLIENECSFSTLLENVKANPVLDSSLIESTVIIYPEEFFAEFKASSLGKEVVSRNILTSDSESFKGLESEVVYVWVPRQIEDLDLKDYLYKSVSRARAICFVIAKDKKSLMKQAIRLQESNNEPS